MDDLEERVFGVLPDATWFYAGHGDDSSLGMEPPQDPRVARPRLVATISSKVNRGPCNVGQAPLSARGNS